MSVVEHGCAAVIVEAGPRMDPRFDRLGQWGGPLRELVVSVRRFLSSEQLAPAAAWQQGVASLGLSRREVLLMITADKSRFVAQDPPWLPAGACGHTMTAGPRQGEACRERGVESALGYFRDGSCWRQWRCCAHRGEVWDLQLAAARRETSSGFCPPRHNVGGLLGEYLPEFDWSACYR